VCAERGTHNLDLSAAAQGTQLQDCLNGNQQSANKRPIIAFEVAEPALPPKIGVLPACEGLYDKTFSPNDPELLKE
jgi:hypothetical protein